MGGSSLPQLHVPAPGAAAPLSVGRATPIPRLCPPPQSASVQPSSFAAILAEPALRTRRITRIPSLLNGRRVLLFLAYAYFTWYTYSTCSTCSTCSGWKGRHETECYHQP